MGIGQKLKPTNGPALEFEAQFWAAAGKMRGHMQVEPLRRRVVSNLKESRTLAALLPKLLSGELRVPTIQIDKTYAQRYQRIRQEETKN